MLIHFPADSASCQVEIIIKIIYLWACDQKMTPRLGISFLAQARFDNLIRGAAKITKEVMKSHGCTFQFSRSCGSFHCPCLQFVQMELSRRKVPVYVSIRISFRTSIEWKTNVVFRLKGFYFKRMTGSRRLILFTMDYLHNYSWFLWKKILISINTWVTKATCHLCI